MSNNYRAGRDFQFQFICHTIPIILPFNIKETIVGIHTDVRRDEIMAVF
jgi:hypothetical protein